ncbi:hypothetical protein K3148_04040 [Qipengyuania aurantiaca]|uniref:Secreted protein n=1 Tax=Qipengyuania aurantiaca TaxID=2867233 RepID=A0ABX8ZTU5_9SPHN|nr:hypothetical protein [Qipengyuania aurantiaca]QZD90573.1 hypothetical protein K3148_04040 [Qipengyuania aurantiaca]
MKLPVIAAALSLSIGLVACGEPIDGSDTADMAPDAVSGETIDTSAAEYKPGEDGPLQSDGMVDDTQYTTEESLEEDPAVNEDAAM